MAVATESRIRTLFAARFQKSAELYQRGLKLFPNGVTHDGRFLKPFPIYANDAAGSRKTTVEGHSVIDYWCGHGAMLLGHSHPAIVEAVQRQVSRSTHPGACHELELEWGELVQQLVPSAERIRFTNSGTEATLMAIRIARLVTGRNKIIKFAGHFHGWHDGLMPAAAPPHGSTYKTPGVTDGVKDDLIIVSPNNLDELAAAIDEHQPACVIHEGNGTHWGVVPARADFIRGLRELTADRNTIFILDEVITGFRVHPHSFQGFCEIVPDMTTLAKVLAGGLPGGCLAARKDLMDALAFENSLGQKMKHPGTYNANPLSASAGVAALKLVATGEPSKTANAVAETLRRELNTVFTDKDAKLVAYGDFSAVKILSNYEGPRPATDDFIPYDNDWRRIDCPVDPEFTHAFRCALLLGGVDWMNWGGSTSQAHSLADVGQTATAYAGAIDLLREDGFDV
ncbi:MAG: aminotransferase class III-fold pyridoxal phosphate-dependent enzyme [Planctomycetota bacterium]|nr:aminotransferase class III-fold pyridoxal phosphate-dependent enzyme [Planctomycetota bacterium]